MFSIKNILEHLIHNLHWDFIFIMHMHVYVITCQVIQWFNYSMVVKSLFSRTRFTFESDETTGMLNLLPS